MTPQVADKAVVATYMDLADLVNIRSGSHLRFHMLLEAACRAARDVAVLSVFEQNPAQPVNPQQHSQRATQQLRDAWGINASVHCVPRTAESPMPWIVRQTIDSISYRRQQLPSRINSQLTRQTLQMLLAGASFLLAYRLPMMRLAMNVRTAGLPLIFDIDDIEHLTQQRAAILLPRRRDRWFARRAASTVERCESKAIRRAAQVYVCSESDRTRLLQNFHCNAVHVVPNAVAIPPSYPPLPAAAVMLMVGSMSYTPNLDGAEHFIGQVLPMIRREIPHAELWLAGGNPELLAPEFANAPGVRMLGFVQDLGPVYSEARLALCPVRTGGGTRLKLLEAASLGRAIVSTHIGAEGIGFVDRKHALLEDSPADFAQACLQLLRDDALAAMLASQCRELISARFDREQVISTLHGNLAQALANRPAGVAG